MSEMELIFPIVWKDDRGQRSKGAFSHPFIQIDVTAPRMGFWQRTELMVDTGLSRTSIAPELLALIGAVASGTVRLSGNQGLQNFSTYKLELRFPNFPLGVIAAECAVMTQPLGETGAGGLLGMDVMRLGRLVLDPSGDSYFSLKQPAQLSRPLA